MRRKRRRDIASENPPRAGEWERAPTGRDNPQRRETLEAGATPVSRTMETTESERLTTLNELGRRRRDAHARLATAPRGTHEYAEAGRAVDAINLEWQAAWSRAADATREAIRCRS